MFGLKAFFNNNPVFLEIKHRKLFIKNSDINPLPLSEILSLKTKNEGDSFFLMIKYSSNKSNTIKSTNKLSDDNKIILQFTNYNVRDLCKSLLLTSISDTGVYKEIDYDTSKFINSLSPPLLSIFSDMNCTVSQFYNHLMQSNFYDIRNKPTSLDRLITDRLREESQVNDINDMSNVNNGMNNKGYNFLTRINNYSLLLMNEDTITKPLPSFTKDINFQPIYDLEVGPILEDDGDMGLEVEESRTDLKIDKKDLKRILEISKKKFRGEDIDEESKRFSEQYKGVKYVKRLIL